MSLAQFFSILRARRGVAGLILLATVVLALAWVAPITRALKSAMSSSVSSSSSGVSARRS